VCGKGGKVVLVPLPPAVARVIDHAVAGRDGGPILRNTLGARMDRHAVTRRLRLGSSVIIAESVERVQDAAAMKVEQLFQGVALVGGDVGKPDHS